MQKLILFALLLCGLGVFTSSASAQLTVTATPTFSPAAGTYSSAQTVSISTTTPSATIYYTTNGTTPTTNSTIYSGAIIVSASARVEAIATANNLSTSAVGSAAYTIGTVIALSCSGISLGNAASLNGFVPFPSTNAWNTNIVSAPVDPNSATIVAAPGFAGWYLHPDFGAESVSGIPYVVVDSTTTPTVSLNVDSASQSDVVVAPYPITAPIEGNPADCSGWPDTYNGDAHVLVLDRAKCELYETYNTHRCNGQWNASSETIWDMHNYETRPWSWTSADAAGLSIFPGLVRYDEIASGAINHAIRFTLEQTRNDANGGYFVPPATHAAGNDWTTNNVIGMRIRLKASFDISGFSPVNQIILTAMQQYGLILADNGSNFYFQGASDPRFDDNDLANLEQIASSNFEVVPATPEFPGYDSATAPTGAAPTINSFTASASSISAGNPVTFTYSASGDSYDYIDMIGPVSGGSVTITPSATNTYILYSTNAYGRSVSTPITVMVPGSVVAAPTFTPAAGTYSSTQTVTINTPTSPSATIYYTTDGTTPTTSSTEYSGPITVSVTQTVKAIATVTGYSAPSAVGSAAYTIGSLAEAMSTSTPAVAQVATFQMKLCGDTSSSSGCVPSSSTSTYDSSGNGNNGTWQGTQSGTNYWYSAGLSPLPYAGYFDGTDNYVNLGNSSTLNPTNNFSMTGWVKFASLPTSPAAAWFIARMDASLGKSFQLGWGYGTWWEWNVSDNYGEPYTNSIPIMIPTIGTWYFVAVTGSSSTGYSMSINAGPPTNDVWVAPPTTTGATTIGAQTYTGATGNFNGELQDWRIYNSVLTQSQIAAIYHAVRTQSGTPTFSVSAGTYSSAQTVTISATGGSVICYSTTPLAPQTDNATGCITGTKYTSPVTVGATETLYAVSGGTGYGDSAVGSAVYAITGTYAMNVVQIGSCGADGISGGEITSVTCPLSATQAGNSLLLGCASYFGAISSTVPASIPLMSATSEIYVGLVSNVTLGTTSAVFNFPLSYNQINCEAVEVSGVVTSATQDVSPVGITSLGTEGYGSATNLTGSITTSNANDVIIGFAAGAPQYANIFSPGTGYTLVPPSTYYGNATIMPFAFEYQNVSSTGSYNPGMTWNTESFASVGTAALKLASGSSVPVPVPAPALVAHTAAGYSGSGSGTLPVTTSAINTTSAGTQNLILICTTGYYDHTVPTDNCGNTYQLSGSSQYGSSLFYAVGANTCSSHTFTLGGQAPALGVMVFSGIASGPDQTNGSAGNSGISPFNSGAVTPTNNDELVAGCFYNYTGTVTASSPMTTVDTVPYDGGYNGSFGTITSYEVQTTTTLINPQYTWGSGVYPNVTGVAATFYSLQSPAPLSIATTNLAEGFVSTTYGSSSSIYGTKIVTVGGAGPFTFSVTSGNLPAGLSINSSTGVITGTPTTVHAAVNVTFQVVDSESSPATQTVTIPMTIAATAFSGSANTCTGSALNGTQNSVYGGCSLSAAGGIPPYSYAWADIQTEASLPEGLSINPSTGAISGTDYGEGAFITPFTVSDSVGTYVTVNLHFAMAGNNTLGGCSLFPSDSIMHMRIDSLPVDTSPAAPFYSGYLGNHLGLVFGSGTTGAGYTPNGIPMLTVPASVGTNTILSVYPGYGTPNMFPPNSLTGPCITSSGANCSGTGPIPLYNPVESTAGYNNTGQDQHTSTVVQAGSGHNCQLAEQYQAQVVSGGWHDTSTAFWPDLTQYTMPEQSNGGTTDAAGLPIAPFLVNYDEVAAGAVQHAIRLVIQNTLNYHVWPATAQAGTSANSCTGGGTNQNLAILDQANPPTSCTGITGPMGEMYRLTSTAYAAAQAACPYSTNPEAYTIITALRQYGVILADNGNGATIIGTPDSRWNDSDLSCITTNITLASFEPVNLGQVPIQYGTSYEPLYTSYQVNTSGGSTSTQAATPAFTPAGGTYGSTQTVTISTTTPSATIYYTTNGSTPTTSSAVYSGPITVSSTETLQAIAVAPGYSNSTAGSAAYTITSAAAATTTSLSASPNPVATGQTLTLTAAVQGTGSTTPGGTVNFVSGSTPLGTAPVNSSGVATLTITTLAVGTYSITAQYSGNANFLSSTSAAVSATVYSQATTASLTASPNPVAPGQTLTLTATVQGTGSTAPGGAVSFLSGSTLLGTAPLNSSGVATLTTTSLASGTYSLTAQYSGNASFLSSTSTVVSVTVSSQATTTSLTASPNPVAAGQTLTLTAAVQGTGSTAPAGNVRFMSGSTLLGTATLNSSGVATLSTTSLAAGSYSLTTQYSGNASFLSSTSAAVSVTVNAQATTTSMTPSPNPVSTGQTLTLTAAVQGTGSTTPAGAVSFLSGSTLLGTATLNSSGVATLTTTSLAAGTYSLTAQYSGNTGFLSSTSAAVSVTVNSQANTTTTSLIASPNQIATGQTLTLTAAVQGTGSTAPGGTVSFMSGSTPLGTAPLNSSGVATLTITTLAVGTYSLTAQYSGNASFLSSPSAAVSVTVSSQATTTTTSLTASPNLVATGQTLTLTAAVQGTGSTVPAGTVSFLSGSTPLGTAPVNSSGIATLTITTLAVGTYSITAQYSGNAIFLSSTSAAVSATVSSQATMTTTSLTASPNPVATGQTLTLTAVVQGSGSTAPAGTVNFLNGSALLGTATLNSSGVATLTTTSLAAETYSLTAQYSGYANFVSSTSAAVSVTVNTQATTTNQSFSLDTTGSATSQTVQPGKSALYTLSVSPAPGTTLPAITLTASGLPAGFTATFSPQTIAAGSGATNVTLSIQVPAQTVMLERDRKLRARMFVVALCILLLPFGGRIRRSGKRMLQLSGMVLLLVAAAAFVGLTGCTAPAGQFSSQHAQTYTITVTTTSASVSQTANVTLIVE